MDGHKPQQTCVCYKKTDESVDPVLTDSALETFELHIIDAKHVNHPHVGQKFHVLVERRSSITGTVWFYIVIDYRI